MTRALVMDFDGLLLDTETTDFESWRWIYAEHGVELPRAEWVTAIGTDSKAFDALARLRVLTGRELDAERVQGARRAYRDALVVALEPLPGVTAWLERARAHGLAVGLASSSSRRWVEGHLERVGLRAHFAELVTGDQVQRVKPWPELYQTALARLGVRADEAIAVEDSPNGVAAARAAGLYCVAVPGPMTRGLDFGRADLLLDSLADRSLDAVLEARRTTG